LFVSDAFICLAWCSAAVTSLFNIVFMHMGALHLHMDYFLIGFQGDSKTLKRALLTGSFPYFTIFYLYKATILAFYLQICPVFLHVHKIILRTAIAYTLIGYIILILLNLLLCFPVE
ncbi:hypothetical protein K469DRAFT_598726, partial [Zopfia rhizophila CBS 207.26]